MTIDIIVQRGSGNREGSNVENPLVTTLSVAKELGRNLLDKNSAYTYPVVTSMYKKGVRVGQLTSVHDALQGVSYKAKIVGLSITKHNPEAGIILSIRLEKPVP